MAHWLSAGVAQRIAASITDQLSLSQFSAVNYTCCLAARPILFANISILFRRYGRDVEQIVAFFTSHPHLAKHVHSLTLRGHATPPVISAFECAYIVSHLPSLRTLRLVGLQWVARPFNRREHTALPSTLTDLELDSVWVEGVGGSPLDVAALMPSWSFVSIKFVEHRSVARKPGTLPFVAHSVFIEETLWPSRPAWFTQADCCFLDVRTLAFSLLDPYHFPLLCKILTDNARSLTNLFARISAWCAGKCPHN